MDLTTLIPQFGGLLWTLLAFVVALSVIVAIHELGHYLVGRWSGIKADVFSLGFGPVLFAATDRHGTKWQFALLPLGGYVKFRGDDNASGHTDTEGLQGLTPEERRATMAGAPLWARTATVAAGPVFNFALSAMIFFSVFMLQGTIKDPLTVGDLRTLPAVQELQQGDVIRQIEGKAPPLSEDDVAYRAFLNTLPQQEQLTYTVDRNGTSVDVAGPYVYPPIATQVVPRSAAAEAGFQPGDVIIDLAGAPIFAFDQLKQAVESSEGQPLDLVVWRDGSEIDLTLTPKRVDEPLPEGGFQTVYRIGIVGGIAFDPATESPAPLAAAGQSVLQVGTIIEGSLSGLWHMITGAISTCNLSGPIGIAETSADMASQGASNFIWFIAVLSTAVGLLNLFPVPVLDGGHLVFFAYEAVSGRPPSDRALKVLMSIGLTVVLGLMVFALTNDIFCP